MTWRVAVTLPNARDFARDQVTVLLGHSDQAGTRLALPMEVVLDDAVIPPLATLPEPAEPWLTLPTEAAEALMNALCAHFHGTSDVVRLAEDLRRERQRYDQLVAALLKLGASGLPGVG